MVEAPSRNQRTDDIDKLAALMASGAKPKSASPVTLGINELNECPSLFQPRYQSLLWQGRSNDHVREMFRVLKSSGRPLDAIAVVSFGSKWLVVDGHHRLEAYKLAKWKAPVPVRAIPLKETKVARLRIKEAEILSVFANVRDKLPMSAPDKADTAWRITFHHDDLSKTKVSEMTTLSTSLVAYMRKAKKALLANDRYSSEEIGAWRWARARYEYARVLDPNLMDKEVENQDEHHIHLVAKAISGILGKGVTAGNIVEAFHRIDPILLTQLEEALAMRKSIIALGI